VDSRVVWNADAGYLAVLHHGRPSRRLIQPQPDPPSDYASLIGGESCPSFHQYFTPKAEEENDRNFLHESSIETSEYREFATARTINASRVGRLHVALNIFTLLS
jgi:hypothetical protein